MDPQNLRKYEFCFLDSSVVAGPSVKVIVIAPSSGLNMTTLQAFVLSEKQLSSNCIRILPTALLYVHVCCCCCYSVSPLCRSALCQASWWGTTDLESPPSSRSHQDVVQSCHLSQWPSVHTLGNVFFINHPLVSCQQKKRKSATSFHIIISWIPRRTESSRGGSLKAGSKAKRRWGKKAEHKSECSFTAEMSYHYTKVSYATLHGRWA